MRLLITPSLPLKLEVTIKNERQSLSFHSSQLLWLRTAIAASEPIVYSFLRCSDPSPLHIQSVITSVQNCPVGIIWFPRDVGHGMVRNDKRTIVKFWLNLRQAVSEFPSLQSRSHCDVNRCGWQCKFSY